MVFKDGNLDTKGINCLNGGWSLGGTTYFLFCCKPMTSFRSTSEEVLEFLKLN